MAKKISFGQRVRAAWHLAKSGSISHPAELLGAIAQLLFSHEAVSGAQVNPATAMRVAAVYACVGVISETLGMLPLKVYRRNADGTKEEEPEHPLARLIKHPNPWQNRMEFIEMMAMHVCLRGNAYAFMNKVTNAGTGKEFIAELLPLHPDHVRVEVLPDKLPTYWYTPIEGGKSSKEIQISWEQILHIRYRSLNGYTGLSPISAARDVIGMGITLQEHSGNLFKRGAHTGGVLTHPETLDGDTGKRIRESWQETYGGAKNAGNVLVLEEGMTYSAVGMSMQDAQYIDTRKLNRIEIASIFRVPPHKIAAADKVSYNSMEQAGLEFVTDCIAAWCTRFELAFDRDLVRSDNRFYTKFNLSALLRGDLKSRYDAFRVGREGGWLSPNDIRAMEDMNPIPDGDIYLQPMNFVPLGTEAAPPKEPPAAPPPEDEETPEDERHALRIVKFLTRRMRKAA